MWPLPSLEGSRACRHSLVTLRHVACLHIIMGNIRNGRNRSGLASFTQLLYNVHRCEGHVCLHRDGEVSVHRCIVSPYHVSWDTAAAPNHGSMALNAHCMRSGPCTRTGVSLQLQPLRPIHIINKSVHIFMFCFNYCITTYTGLGSFTNVGL